MTRAQLTAKRNELMQKMNGHVHLTWKQLAWFGGLVVLPWAMTVTVGVAISNYVNIEQQKTLDARMQSVQKLERVETDVWWIKQSQRRVEQRLFGNSVIPVDDEKEGGS